ncbi:MAG: DUF3267 domain-containing protein [Solobacterium sp.]|nr:DUF3267 domain-containing protein [Solobacterium sp.]
MTEKRKLTEKEQKRLDRFEQTAEGLQREGYRRVDLVVDIGKANAFGLVMMVPLFIGGFLAFWKLHPEGVRPFQPALFLLLYLAMIVVHELIHGITWSLFSEHHWQDIDFGIMLKLLTPYCTCAVPLAEGPYIAGALMPLIVLGILPTIAALVIGSMLMLEVGLMMIVSAAGDILIVWKLRRHRTDAKDIIILDHPTEAGTVIFER